MDNRFIIAFADGNPTLLCTPSGRCKEPFIGFLVANGGWRGVLDTATGNLTVRDTRTIINGCRVLDLVELPKGDYNKVLAWAEARVNEIGATGEDGDNAN